jgi:hypothetical protein
MENIIASSIEMNKTVSAPLTAEERRIKLRAQIIRKKFARATETVQRILAAISDADLCAKEAAHHAVKVGALAAQRQRKLERR